MARRVLILYWPPSGLLMRAAIHHCRRVLDHSRSELDVLYFNALHGVPSWIRHATSEALILHAILLCLRWSEHFETMRRDRTNPFIPEELWSQSARSMPWFGSPRLRPLSRWQPAPGRLGLFRSCPDS